MRGQRVSGLLLSCAVAFTTVQPTAHAAMVTTSSVAVHERAPASDPSELAERLHALGVPLADAQRRVSSLTAEERDRLAAEIDQLPAGGDILGALAFIGLVFLLSDILGYTDVYPFVTRTVNGDKPSAKRGECVPDAPAAATPSTPAG